MSAQAVLWQANWNSGVKKWEKYRTYQTTKEAIDIQIKRALEISPSHDFYKFELWVDDEFQGNVYTLNPCLFIM